MSSFFSKIWQGVRHVLTLIVEVTAIWFIEYHSQRLQYESNILLFLVNVQKWGALQTKFVYKNFPCWSGVVLTSLVPHKWCLIKVSKKKRNDWSLKDSYSDSDDSFFLNSILRNLNLNMFSKDKQETVELQTYGMFCRGAILELLHASCFNKNKNEFDAF